MRNLISTVTVLTLIVAVSAASYAAPILTVVQGVSTGGNELFTFNVDPNGTVLDTIDITLSTTDAFIGENVTAVTEFVAGNENTDVLGVNTVALGWSILMTDDSPTLLKGAGGPLGQDITAAVNFAQAVFPVGQGYEGAFTFNYADNGGLVGSESGTFSAVPEPTTLGLAVLGLCGFVARRRRNS